MEAMTPRGQPAFISDSFASRSFSGAISTSEDEDEDNVRRKNITGP